MVSVPVRMAAIAMTVKGIRLGGWLFGDLAGVRPRLYSRRMPLSVPLGPRLAAPLLLAVVVGLGLSGCSRGWRQDPYLPTAEFVPVDGIVGGYSVTVQPGDSVYAIARGQGVPTRAIIVANDLQPPYVLHPGQVLVLPTQRVHTVVVGDTLYALSRRYGPSVAAIANANGLAPPYQIQVGQRVVIPVDPAPPASVVASLPAATPPPSWSPGGPVGDPMTPSAPLPSPPSSPPEPWMTLAPLSEQGMDTPPPQAGNDGTPAPIIEPGAGLLLTDPVPWAPADQTAASPSSSVSSPSAQGQVSAVPGPESGHPSRPASDDGVPVPPTRPETSGAPGTARPQAWAPVAGPEASTPPESTVAPSRPSAPVPAPPPRAGERFHWPVMGEIIGRFGGTEQGLHNDGVNIAVPMGTPIRAADNGVVAYAGNEIQGFGILVLVKHAGGWMTAYAHASRLEVRRGDTVKRGQVIARVGRSGSVDQPQLHFEIRRDAKPVDPLDYLAPASRV